MPNDVCCHGKCESPESGFGRREFLKRISLGITALALAPRQMAMAGPFTRKDFEKLVPVDKRLSAAWISSLTDRGTRAVYTGKDLETIGMPVGGVCAGQLYLGGDGRLWHWDIFNAHIRTGAEHYASPLKPTSVLEQGFALKIVSAGKSQERTLKTGDWKTISFTGEYPIGHVSYSDPECPVQVSLEAYSPFCPLRLEDSSIPATIFDFELRNTSRTTVQGVLAGWLENGVCLHSAPERLGQRRNRVVRHDGLLFLDCSAEEAPAPARLEPRPDIVFDDFERESYGEWVVSGTAFGDGPVEASRMPEYQGNVGSSGKRLVNSHASAPGNDIGGKDHAVGRLLSRPFTIERHYLRFLIGGGNHKGKTCVNLMVDGQAVLSVTGPADNKLRPAGWSVRRWLGKTARLEIVDDERGGWGNIGVDDIVFTDTPPQPVGPLAEAADFGTMGLALLEPGTSGFAQPEVPGNLPGAVFSTGTGAAEAKKPFANKLVGALGRKFKLKPGKSVRITFMITWHMPNLILNRLPPGRFYATKFNSAQAVAAFVAKHYARLSSQTRLWHQTWYDSTLPYWFLDRTFLNTSILASSTCYQLGNGRFYSYEGVGCCEGSCGHVWHYAHAPARIFPELERQLREQVDFGLALQPDGAILFRGEFNRIPAIDSQAGAILRTLREHQMSANDAFLRRVWPQVKKATEWLIGKDANADGLIESNQHNTLDTDWFGPVAWLSGLYLAALMAAETMANELGDREFAGKCRRILEVGQKNLTAQLFDGEYFINKVAPEHREAINSGTGCHIDQVMGQSWAFQVGLPRVFPATETRAALKSLWKYNFTPDVGPYREAYKAGRWYAMPGEAGLLMCTFPRNDWDYAQAKGKGVEWAAGYFNECMNGFEYQAAGHMIWEGLVTEGLAATRAVHDRYHPSRRNPWNEVECGDHYIRSMASYGVYLAACGYYHHGPQGVLGFAPKVSPENFKAAFTSAEGWGTFSQQRATAAQNHAIELKHGRLVLRKLTFDVGDGVEVSKVSVKLGGRTLGQSFSQAGNQVTVNLRKLLQLRPGAELRILLAV